MNAYCRAAVAMPLLSLCLLGLRQTAAVAEEAKDAQPGVEAILKWLPEDTETLVVTSGTFKVPEMTEEGKGRMVPLAESLEAFACHPFGISPEGGKKLAGREVTLAVEGARKFSHPKSLGMWHYEGCHILILKEDLDDSWSKALAAGDAKVEKISGQDVYCFEIKQGIPPEDPWTYYFAQPKPNVLLGATNKDYLTETLRRMEKGRMEDGGKRALPDDLPEWKQVDRTARFWAIRHYANPPADEPIQSPHLLELVARGFTFSFNPAKEPDGSGSLKIRYLADNDATKNEAAKAAIERIWKSPAAHPLTATVEQSDPGTIEVTVKFPPDQAASFLFLLLYNLGHVVAV